MTGNDRTDRLSARHQSVLVIRLVVEDEGRVSGELVDPLSKRRQRFSDPAELVDAVRRWIGDALSSVRETTSQSKQQDLDT